VSTDLAVREHSVNEIEIMAKQVGRSGLFGMNEAQAFTLMLLAQAKGIHPIQAVERYHVISGRPAMKADAILADFQRNGGVVEWVTMTDQEFSAIFTHPVNAPKGVTVSFSMADAKRAELTNNKMWSKYPKNMLRARVISNGMRLVMPGIVAGIYTPEEVMDFDDEPAPQAKVRVVEDREHHAKNNGNGTGHGRTGAYAPPETVKAYQAWLKEFVEAINNKWLDHWTDASGNVDHRVADLLNTFQLSGHLVKWAKAEGLINAPDEPRSRQYDPLAAIAWSADKKCVDAEATAYCRGLWKAEKARIEAGTEAEDENQDAEHGEAYEGDLAEEALAN
jgi:hypothetical protein